MTKVDATSPSHVNTLLSKEVELTVSLFHHFNYFQESFRNLVYLRLSNVSEIGK